MCGAANRYVDAQAPWTLRKSDPARMATVLWVLAETVRRLAILTQPFMPDASAKLLDLLADPAGRALTSRRSDDAAAPGTALPPPTGVFPRHARARGGMIVDSHCHLDYPGLAEDEAGVIERARAAGVGHHGPHRGQAVAAGRSASRSPSAGPRSFCAVGVHPHEAGREGLDDPAPLVELAAIPRVVAIGESGLDYFYDFSPRDRQAASFRTHIAAARETGLPLVVHTRDADDDTMALLEAEMGQGPFTGVIHCYSSSRRLAERAVAIGLYLGIGGILTFKKSEELRATVRDLPLDRLLLETDAPYLAPVPMRGRTNEPAYTAHVAKVLAEVRGSAGGRDRGRDHRQLPAPVRQGRPVRVTVLGCGTSSGVPQIGCDCAVCRSPDPRNRRRRCSIFIEAQGQRILVDTGPDLRQQCLDAGIGEIDALLYTHAHADHVHGIDDLRTINNLIMAPIPA